MKDASRFLVGMLFAASSAYLAGHAQVAKQNEPLPNSGGIACVVTPEQLHDFISLSYEDFDQDLHGGFRKFAHQGCELTAAMIIDSYVLSAPSQMNVIERGNLLFHAGQLYAYSGLNELAAQRFLQSLNLHEKPDTSVAWNTYVMASVAFLRGDRPELIHQRDVLARAKATTGNQMNLRVVDRFVQCFGRPYNQAYETCSSQSSRTP